MFLGTTVGNDGVSEELVKFWVFLDGHEDASWHNSGLLEALGVVAGQLEDFSGEVLEDGSEVDWSSSSDSLGISALSEESGDSAHWEVETSSGRSRGLLGGSCLSFSLAFACDSHFD